MSRLKFAILMTTFALGAGLATSACVARAEAAQLEQDGDAKTVCCEGVPNGFFCYTMDPGDSCGGLVPLAEVCREHT